MNKSAVERIIAHKRRQSGIDKYLGIQQFHVLLFLTVPVDIVDETRDFFLVWILDGLIKLRHFWQAVKIETDEYLKMQY